MTETTDSDKTNEIVHVLEAGERPFMGTGELADELGYTSNPGVMRHLEKAKNAGEVCHADISGYNIWYLPSGEQHRDTENCPVCGQDYETRYSTGDKELRNDWVACRVNNVVYVHNPVRKVSRVTAQDDDPELMGLLR